MSTNRRIGIKQYCYFDFLSFINLTIRLISASMIIKNNIEIFMVVLRFSLFKNIELIIMVKEIIIKKIVIKLYNLFIDYQTPTYIFVNIIIV